MNNVQAFETPHYKITFEDRENYLYSYVETSENGAAVLLGYWREIADAVKRFDATRLMVQKGKAPEASTSDSFTVAASLREMGLDGIPIALVKHQSVSAESNRFVENVARNRGVLMSVFDNAPDAEKWLLSA